MYTTRDIYSMGLIAGLSYTEMRHMFPGFIMDMFIKGVKHDAKMMTPKKMKRMLG